MAPVNCMRSEGVKVPSLERLVTLHCYQPTPLGVKKSDWPALKVTDRRCIQLPSVRRQFNYNVCIFI